MISDRDFLRYSRQLLLEEFGVTGQQKLQHASVLIVGLGGLGSPAALWLAAAGVGKLLLADNDTLHISNLQRQILYRSADCGKAKAQLAQNQLQSLNPQVEIIALQERVDEERLRQLVPQVSLVLDCSDNMTTRHAINSACVAADTPLISGSAVGYQRATIGYLTALATWLLPLPLARQQRTPA